MKAKIFFSLFFFLCLSSYSFAGRLSIDLKGLTVQEEFKALSEDLGNLIRITPLSPAEPLGLLGFDLGIESGFLDIAENSSFWEKALPENPPPGILFPRLRLQKGLPFDLDLGVVYTVVPLSNIKSFGGELKWAFLPGDAVTPAIALRGAYSTLFDLDNLELNNFQLDLSISKGFLFLTPYAGVGQYWTKSRPRNLNLSSVEITQTRAFAGTKISLLGLGAITLQADLPAPALYSIKISLNF